MMDARAIRGWLLCLPRPVKLRVVSEDQSPHEINIVPGTSWAQVSQSVEALRPEVLEALAADGSLIRVCRPSEEDEEDEDDGYTVNADGESQRLIVFAKLLADAYKHSTQTAFDKLGELFETVTRRSESLEKTVEAMNRVLVKTAIEQAATAGEEAASGGGGGFEQLMMQAFMQGQANKKAAEAANGVVPPVKS